MSHIETNPFAEEEVNPFADPSVKKGSGGGGGGGSFFSTDLSSGMMREIDSEFLVLHIPEPTSVPTPEPTSVPTPEPTSVPTPEPTSVPTPEPTSVPTPEPTSVPTPEPTSVPTPDSTSVPIPAHTSVLDPSNVASPHVSDSNVASPHVSIPDITSDSNVASPHVSSRLSSLPPEPYESGATIDIPLDTHSTKDVKAKEKELQAKEAELKRREQELKRREEAIERAGIVIEEKNWPAFFPIIHNDIASEIPIHLQSIMYVAFATLIGLVICLLYNVVAATTAWTRGYGLIIWLLAVIYILTGVPGGFYLWYSPIYKAARTDSALSFGTFFLGYSVHIMFCVFAAVAPGFLFREGSITGILAALVIFPHDHALGIIFFVGFALFCCESLVSIWVIQQVFMYFRGSGKAAEMKREAAKRTMMSAL
ncbi:hypothetical protein HRI_001646800 [Hibiscus trionum]|uniref:Secretory carrier-associated membrane protein n=1 Tax=Hibiscus trionum TaxID=183268 RepID=A0A9W7LYN7_HIBTR|nr:hypothetical protein HRI_001646800 [Hibiscus trionum]